MELHSENDDRSTPRTVLGHRLRRLREGAGLSQRGLADKVGYPHTYLSRVERGEQLPSSVFAEDLDACLETDGLFGELLSLARDSPIPDYGVVVIRNEQKAARIQVFASSLIPGLLQTEEYARALIRASVIGESEERITVRVTERMQRKQVFERADPPLYWAIMDEAALRRPIGGAHCMAQQIRSILEVAAAPHVTVQVLPFGQGEHPLLGGSLTLLSFQKGSTFAYVESFASGEPVETPARIVKLTQKLDLARAKSLPVSESLGLLHKYLKGYESEQDS